MIGERGVEKQGLARSIEMYTRTVLIDRINTKIQAPPI